MLVKRLLILCCLLTGLSPINADAQEHMRFRPDNEAFFLTKDAAANQLYSLAALNARAYLQKPAPGVRTQWLSEELTARYTIALAGLKTGEPGAVDSAKALLSTIVDEPVRD